VTAHGPEPDLPEFPDFEVVVGEDAVLQMLGERGYRWTRISGHLFTFSMNDVMRLRARDEWRSMCIWAIVK
jgi:hypothetical protein